MINEIIEKMGKDLFFKIKEFSDILNLDVEDAKSILNDGKEKGIFIQTMENEFAFKENIAKEIMDTFDVEISKKYTFGNLKEKRLSLIETHLRDEILQDMALKKRDLATEMLVLHIERNNHIYTTRDDKNSEMWIYEDGIYIPEGKSYVKEYSRKILGAVYTSHFINNVIEKIETDTFIDSNTFFNQNIIDEIPVQNGILNIHTRELSIFNPRKIFFNKLPITYDSSSKCPMIEEHFETILKDKEDAKVMFELFGYALLKENKLEKAFMMVGNGRNGKSKTLELMKKFVGVNNCSALALSSMNSDSFSLSELFGRFVNLAGDLSYTDLKDTGMIKQLIGRDEIQSKRKFKTDLNFVNYSKLIFSTNELPRVYDLTDGFWTKWVLLEFPYKFISQKEYDSLPKDQLENKKIMNTDIIEQITTEEEMSGLLNKALDSLKIILENKEFSYSKGTDEVKNLWIRQSDSFMAFCFDKLEESYDSKISKKALRKCYLEYCKFHKLKSTSDKSIKITLENMFGAIEVRFGDTSNGWEGFKFKQL